MSAAVDIEVVFTPAPWDAVERGAALLDQMLPGWRKTVSVVHPLGEVRVLYAAAMRKAGRRPWTTGAANHYGFDAWGTKAYGQLQQAWREALLDGRP